MATVNATQDALKELARLGFASEVPIFADFWGRHGTFEAELFFVSEFVKRGLPMRLSFLYFRRFFERRYSCLTWHFDTSIIEQFLNRENL